MKEIELVSLLKDWAVKVDEARAELAQNLLSHLAAHGGAQTLTEDVLDDLQGPLVAVIESMYDDIERLAPGTFDSQVRDTDRRPSAPTSVSDLT